MEAGSSSLGAPSSSVAPSSRASASGVKLDKDGNPKRKRKQLVACDGCRLRRVKCNKADVGEGECSECLKKNIRCTDTYVRTKPKIVRSGKLIQQAKILYGDGGPSSNPNHEPPEPSPTEATYGKATESKQVIRAAEARFINGELARAISGHLIEAYGVLVHSQCPILDWDGFKKSWNAVGQSSEKMSPTGECVSMTIQAWAARFSDNSLIIGTGAASLSDVYKQPGRDFSDCGNARDNFARAMADRVLRMMDARGLLRRPSGAAASALIMLEFLMTWGDEHRSTGRHLMAAAVEHLRAVNDGLSDDPTEEISVQDRASGGTLFWMAYTRDALSSAFGGRATCLSEDDLAVLCGLLANPITADVMTYVTSHDPRILTGLGVVSLFRNITTLIRSFAAHVAAPLPRRQRLNVAAVREVWAGMDVSARYISIFHDSVHKASLWGRDLKADVWFRDLTAMRAQLSHVVHRSIIRRLETEQRSSAPQDAAYQLYVDSLERLKLESDERFLEASRELVKLARSYGTSLVVAACLTCENLPVYLSHMLATPVWEQGGSRNWTLSAKQEEVSWAIAALKLLGWCWPNYQRPIIDAQLALDELAAQAEQARAVASASSQSPHDQHLLPGQHQYQPFEHDQHIHPSSSSYQYSPPNDATQQQHPHSSHPSQLSSVNEPWRGNPPPQLPYPENYDDPSLHYSPVPDHLPPSPAGYYAGPPGPPQYPSHAY